MAKAKYITQKVARDLKTGRFTTMRIAARRPKSTAIQTVRIPVQPRAA